MGRILPALLVAAVLAGCGTSHTDGGLRPDPQASEPPTEAAAPLVLGLVSGSAAGGRPSSRAVPVSDPDDLAGFVEQFEAGLDEEVTRKVRAADVPQGLELYAAVVALGCEPPERVEVSTKAGRLRVTPVPRKPSGTIQCLVPITTVALVTAPADLGQHR